MIRFSRPSLLLKAPSVERGETAAVKEIVSRPLLSTITLLPEKRGAQSFTRKPEQSLMEVE